MGALGLAGASDGDNGGGCIVHVANSQPRIAMTTRSNYLSDCPKGASTMEKISLTALAREQLETARTASSGRSAHTVYGGHEHALRQTLIALTAGSALHDH